MTPLFQIIITIYNETCRKSIRSFLHHCIFFSFSPSFLNLSIDFWYNTCYICSSLCFTTGSSYSGFGMAIGFVWVLCVISTSVKSFIVFISKSGFCFDDDWLFQLFYDFQVFVIIECYWSLLLILWLMENDEEFFFNYI